MTTTTPERPTAMLVPVDDPLFSIGERQALAGFLAGYNGLTRDAYTLDLRQYTAWCTLHGLHLFQAKRVDIESFRGDMEAAGRARATVARRLCTIAGFYRYAEEERAVPPCRTQGSAFELSLAAGFRGAGDPVGAAKWFVRHGGVTGFGHPSSVWVLADPGQVRRGAATLFDGSVSLHAVRMPNGTWAIDSGTRCG